MKRFVTFLLGFAVGFMTVFVIEMPSYWWVVPFFILPCLMGVVYLILNEGISKRNDSGAG